MAVAELPTASPSGTAPRKPATEAELDRDLDTLAASADAWATTSIDERIRFLRTLRRDFADVADEWVAASLAAEGVDAETAGGEKWLAGPYLVLKNLRLLERSLEDVERYGRPRVPGAVRRREDGRVTAEVFPTDAWDRLFFPGVTAEVWMQPGVTREELPETQARAYREEWGEGGVSLVLGAGNVSSIGPMDALYELFANNRVVLFKAHPVNEYLGPLLERAFRSLGERGFFRLVYGGAEVGEYLTSHPKVDHIHITGSDRTYEAIVFGTGPEGERRKRENRPRNTTPVTAELGNVSPVIVVPGPWSRDDFAYQGENLVSSLINNAGFNCNASRVVVQHAGWDGRERLLEAMRRSFDAVPVRPAYYPGAHDRCRRFLGEHPEAERFGPLGTAPEGEADDDAPMPWTLVPDLDPDAREEICYDTEAFCGLVAEVGLEAADPVEFLERAVAFANERLWGTLNVTVLVHPASRREPRMARAVERAVAELRYGTVSLNHWAAVGYGLVTTPWGAYPGHTPDDIQSGTGVVHNALLFSSPEKAVVRAPFRAKPKPPWFASHATGDELGRRLTRFEADPGASHLPGIFWAALRG